MLYYLLEYFVKGRFWYRLYDTTFRFKQLLWLPELSVDLFCLLVASAALGALMVLFGVKTRLGAALVLIGFSYLWLLEKSSYNNHYYLMSLLALLFVFVGGSQTGRPTAAWHLWLFRFQISVVYFYGGVAKLQPDWLAAEPISLWFGRRAERFDLPWLASDVTHYGASLGGLYLDLFAPLFLLWKPGRWVAVPLLVGFHCANQQLFSIGVFPSLMIASTVLFFDGDELRRLRILRLPARFDPPARTSEVANGIGFRLALLGLVLVYVVIQIAVPLRHFTLPGDPSWTERAHWYSWRMMLRTKTGDQPIFYRHTEGGVKVRIPGATYGLNRRQVRDLGRHPHMLDQYARELSRRYDQPISVLARVKLNKGQQQALIDPSVPFRADGPSRPNYILPLTPREHPRPIPGWALYLHLAVAVGLAMAAWKATGRWWWLAALVPAGVGAAGAWATLYLVGVASVLGVGFACAGSNLRTAPLWSLALSVPLLLSLTYLVWPGFAVLR